MRVYISGKISGLPFDEVKRKFDDAEQFLSAIGLEPVSPLLGADQSQSWKELMLQAIELQFGCDAIYLMENWVDSKGARIEKKIAEETGMIILFESNYTRKSNGRIERIKNAIESVTGIAFDEYTTSCREVDKFYARVIFVNSCSKELMLDKEIASIIEKPVSLVTRYRRKYEDELRFNRKFEHIAKQVENILIDNVSQ